MSSRGIVFSVAAAAALAGAGWGAWQAQDDHGIPSKPAVSSLSKFEFTTYPVSRPVPALAFSDDAGQGHSLDEFRGKLVLLNVWATWCPPCREEMPTLDRLQQNGRGENFEVVPLSIDAGKNGVDLVQQFYREAKVRHLPVLVDSTGRAAEKLGTVGLPTTLLIGPDGREIGRTIGPANWSSPEVMALIRSHLDALNAEQK